MPLDDDPIFYDVWQHPDDMLMGSLKSIQDDLYILPSLLDNALLDGSLRNPADQKIAVSRVCNELKKNGFDLVIIDCPPSLGTAVISTICAADLIVIPVGSDTFSFRGLEMTLDEIKSICQTFKLNPPDIMILLVKFTKREKLSFTALHKLETEHQELFLPVVIRTSTAFAKALELKKTVFANTRQSTARADYDRYVVHILGMDDTLMKRENTNDGES
jgi:chromosome partitioning protein